MKDYNSRVRIRFLMVLVALLTTMPLAQGSQSQSSENQDSAQKGSSNKAAADKSPSQQSSEGQASPDKNAASGGEAEASSSRDTRVDISPPKDDDKDHPESKAAVAGLEASDNADTSGVQEFHPWSPMKALKDVEVGDFYFKRKNYKAALERYREALYYKEGDAVASFRLAECQEKLGDKAEAKKYYEQYLKILPDGPLAKDAHAGLDRTAKAQ